MNTQKLTEIYRKYKKKFILTHMVNYLDIKDVHDQYVVKTVMCHIFSMEERKLILRISKIDKIGYGKSYRRTLESQYGHLTPDDIQDIKQTLEIDEIGYLTLDFNFKNPELDSLFSNKVVFFTNNFFFEKKEEVEAYHIIAQKNRIYVPEEFDIKEYLQLLLDPDELKRQYDEITEGGV
jgi:hypothetical protein